MSAQSRSGGASVEALSVGASRFDFRLVRRLALRDLRGSLRGFSVFVTCLALGVAIITAVGIVADSLTAGFTGEGRRLLGGDVALTRVHSKATAEERVAFARYGRVSEIATLRTMADRARTESEPSQAGPGRSASETVDDIPRVMVEVKAVDGAYPLVGELRGALREENAGRAADEAAALDERLQNGNVAVVAPLLLERLGLSIGDEIALGAASVRIIDTLTLEPDGLTGRAAFGPRVLVSLDTLEASGLVGPGSLVRWRYRIDVTRQDDTGAAASHVATVNEITRAFAPLGYGVRDRRDPAPGITQGISRFRQFLTLVGLTAMFVGGIGVANAVAAFLDGRAATIATLRAIGADSRTVNAIYLLEIMIVAALGVALGLLLGIGLPYLAWLIWGGAITLPIVFTVSGFTVALAAGYGLLVALVFVLWPLGRIEHMRPALLFREQVAGALPRPSLRFALATGLALALLVALTVFASGNPTIALWFFVGVAVMFGIFLGLAEAIRWLALKIPRVGGVASAMALRNLAGPGALTRPIVLSLGTGLTLLVSIALIDASLTRELAGRLPQNAPSFFFLDVAKQEADRFREVLRVEAPQAEAETAPMLRGRIVAVKGVPAAEVQAGPDAAWALNGDRGLTFADAVPAGSKVTEGTWWPADYVGPPLVSLEENIARGLGLGIGDTLTVNVLGRPIEATVGSLRSVDWGTLSINFVLLYSPNTLSAAPFNYVMTLTWPGAPSMAKEAEVLKAVDRAFPEVTAIRVRDAIDQAGKLIARILTAVRGLGGLTLFVGAIVLAGAITTTQRRRIRQGVLLKTLGASPARVLRIGMTEFALLAFATGVVALMLGTLGAWLVTTQVMDVVFTFTVRSVIEALGIALAITLVLGGIALWRTLQVRPVPYLRAG